MAHVSEGRTGRRWWLACVLAAAIAATGGVAARASDAPAGHAARRTATVRIALDYSANVNYLGIYVALAKGWFANEGVQAKIIPYANTPAETLVESGATDLGISYPPDVIINRARGLRYRAVAALVAHNTTALAVLASSRYTRPAQLSGTLYGGFGIASDKPIVSAILRGDGVAKPSFKQVVLPTDAYDALSKGRIQYTAVFGGIDDVTARLEGYRLRIFPYRRYLGAAGDYPNAVFVASDAAIAKEGPALRGALAALARGYAFAARHPAAAEQLLIAQNRTALGKSQKIVTATGNATAPEFLDAGGRWGPMTASDFAGLERILVRGGVVEGAPPKPADLFTNSLLPRS
jgi:ABC-type nitrate/sulfonate/bicarbonate transport system substrate-binding protein